ncbi:MAG TPA: radical SAM protein [Candidatus Obscuribacterales bacterium]
MKIALVSMNGIRAHDKELLRLGLNLPGFVERSKAIASLPSLGLLTLGGVTPEHHDLTYIEVPDLKSGKSLPSGFDLVAISTFSAQVEEAYELSDRWRKNGTTVVMGGNHVSSLPDEALEHCDCVMIGEGELTWPEMLQDAEAGRLKETYGSLLGNFDLANAPLPAYHLLNPDKYNRVTLQTSRGCPLRCEFCASSVLYTRRYKQKPKDCVLAEVRQIKSIWKRPFIELVDDNAFVDKRYWKALLTELAEEHIRWFAETDVSVAEDAELLDLMRLAGCKEVLIGFESPVEVGLSGVEMNSNWKWKRWSTYKQAIHRIQSHGIRVIACFLVGLDGHGPWIFESLLDFVKEAKPFDVQITVPTAFPGTAYYNRLKAEDRLIDDPCWRKCTLFDVNIRPTHMTAEELASGFRQLGVRLYDSDFTRRRKEHFNELWRKNETRRRHVVKQAI